MSEYIIECEYDFDEGWIPGEQREEIVRCRDCKHYRREIQDEYDGSCWCAIHAGYVDDMCFCAWGEWSES